MEQGATFTPAGHTFPSLPTGRQVKELILNYIFTSSLNCAPRSNSLLNFSKLTILSEKDTKFCLLLIIFLVLQAILVGKGHSQRELNWFVNYK